MEPILLKGDPPSPLKKGEQEKKELSNQLKVPLLKGDLGGSPRNNPKFNNP
jgi:hypothetical protein